MLVVCTRIVVNPLLKTRSSKVHRLYVKTLTVGACSIIAFPALVFGFLGGIVANELKEFDFLAPHIKKAVKLFDKNMMGTSKDPQKQLMKDGLILGGSVMFPGLAAFSMGARAGIAAAETYARRKTSYLASPIDCPSRHLIFQSPRGSIHEIFIKRMLPPRNSKARADPPNEK